MLIDVINRWIWVKTCFLFFFLEREKFKLRKEHFLYITNESRSQSDRNNYTMQNFSSLSKSAQTKDCLAQLLSVFSASVPNNLLKKMPYIMNYSIN